MTLIQRAKYRHGITGFIVTPSQRYGDLELRWWAERDDTLYEIRRVRHTERGEVTRIILRTFVYNIPH